MMSDFLLHLKEGMILLAIGMGVVFAFLVIMVWVMNAMSAFVIWLGKFFPEEDEIVEKKSCRKIVSEDEAIAVAIAVAKAQG